MRPRAPRSTFLTSILDEVARSFEAIDEPEARIDRVLRVMQRFVPYDHCALLEAEPLLRRKISIVPEVPERERQALLARLRKWLELFSEGSLSEARTLSVLAPSGRFHLAVPIVGVGGIIGIVFVERAEPPYNESHLAFLSVIAAQIGAYLSQARADRDLRASEARFRGLYESGMIGIAFLDDHGTITAANETFAAIVGRSRATLEASAVNWHDITAARDLERDRAAIRDARARGRCAPYEKHFIRRDGGLVTVLAGAARLEQEGSVAAFVLDITEKKRIETEREGLLEQRERDLGFLEMFMGILGHDLRTPLGAIRLSAEKLPGARGERLEQVTARILSSSRRMERMIQQLLDLTRIRLAGGMPLEQGRVDLGDVCRRVIDEQLAAHPDASIELRVTGDVSGEWDGDRLLQVVSNLVGNAVQHALGAPEVLVRVAGTRGAVELVTHNRGAIPPSLLPVLFDPFRGTPSRGARGSLGLGLFITKHIVEAHGGSIEVQSSEPEGTTFRVRLPRRPPRPPIR